MNYKPDKYCGTLSQSIIFLVESAYNSMKVNDDDHILLENMIKRFNSVAHPRVKEGSMSPTEAVDRLKCIFSNSANEKQSKVALIEFMRYHEKLYTEAEYENVHNVEAFVKNTIMELWRMGHLLSPTYIRPCLDIKQLPKALYANTLMTLVWPSFNKEKKEMELNAVKEVVRPIFARGELPEELQGYFAFPEELTEMEVLYKKPQISIQRWLDFVWKEENEKYYGIPNIISAKVDLEMLPSTLRQFILEHSDALNLNTHFLTTSTTNNPTYKLTSQDYGIDIINECQKIKELKERTYAGKQYGLQYYGRVNGQFCKDKGTRENNTATGINM